MNQQVNSPDLPQRNVSVHSFGKGQTLYGNRLKAKSSGMLEE